MADEEMPEVDASLVVSAYDWGALGDVVDVGGGDGTLLIALLNEYRALRGTVVDLPATAETARKMFTAAGLADRGNAVAGDFFNTLPPGAEGYLLCSVLHRWDDEHARAILRNCATAAGEDGAVFVIEKTTDATTTASTDSTASAKARTAGPEIASSASAGVEGATPADSPGAGSKDTTTAASTTADPPGTGLAGAGSTDPTTAGSAGAATADLAGAGSADPKTTGLAGATTAGSASPERPDSRGLFPAGGGPDREGERDHVGERDRVGVHDHAGERARDVGELTVLAESAGLAVAAVHTADTVAIIELAMR